MRLTGYFKLLSHTRFLVKRLERRFISESVKEKYYEKVVDIGAGVSPYRKYLNCKHYLAVDCEDRQGSNEVLLADINKGIPLEDGYADLVLCTEVLEHIKEPRFALSELRRIIKENGEIIIMTPFSWPLHEEPNDYFRYTRYGLEYLLAEAGFKEIDIKPANGFFYTVIQIINIMLIKRIFLPMVIVLNLLGIMIGASKGNSTFPLIYLVRAKI